MNKLIITFLILLFTACNNNDNIQETEITPEPTEPVIEREHREIVVAGWWRVFTMSDEPEPMIDDPGDYYTNRLRWEHLNNIVMPDLNITFTYLELPSTQIPEITLTSVIAGDPIADMVKMAPTGALSLAMSRSLQPLESFLEPNNPIFTENKNGVRPCLNIFDQTWSFITDYIDTHGFGIVVNIDMVNRLGLDNPVELYKRGEWDWENFRRLLNEATFSSTGGTIDHVGISSALGDASAVPILHGLIPANSGWIVNPNTFTLDLDTPQTMMALEFIYDILVTDQVHVMNHSNIPVENILFQVSELWRLNEYLFEIDYIPFPKGPLNTTGATNFFNPSTAFSIPVGIHEPEFVFYAFEQAMQWAAHDWDLLSTGEFSWMREVMHNEETVQRTPEMLMPPQQVFEIAAIMPNNFFWGMYHAMVPNFINRTHTPASFVESVRNQMQSEIDEFAAAGLGK